MLIKKTFTIILLFCIIIFSIGCSSENQDITYEPQNLNDNHALKRFQDFSTNSQTAVDSAIELANKNTQLVEQSASLKQKINELAAENQMLKANLVAMEPELKQTKKELTEANDLLIEMRIELNNWKNDVLGFRNEIRDADKAQLESLRRILEALGGEIAAKTSSAQEPNSTTVSVNKESKSG